MRIHPLFATLAVLCLGSLATCSPGEPPREQVVRVTATPVSLYEGEITPPGRGSEIGRLRFRAGFHLTAGSERFGGFSGLALDTRGERLTAVSDQGWWLVADVLHDASGTLTGLGKGRIGPLLEEDGSPVEGRYRRDAEELVLLPEDRSLLTFEAHHRAQLYEGGTPSGRPRLLAMPGAVSSFPENQGIEAAAFVEGGSRGRILLLSEDLPDDGAGILGWLASTPVPGDLSPRWQRLSLTPTGVFQPTGAAALPNGDIVLLERSYSPEDGTRVRLSRIAREDLGAGVTLTPHELARLEPPVTVDNMEAVAARRGPAGETLVYLLSDDNYSSDQRTLLMQFELIPEP